MGWVTSGLPLSEVGQHIDAFFMKRGKVWETLQRACDRLEAENIDHAIIGGMAIVLHGFVRVTADVDLLTTPEGLTEIHRLLVGRGYVPAFPGARKALKDVQTGVKVDFITAGEYPGDGKPKAVRFPDPRQASVVIESRRVISLPKLIELKLASGLTTGRLRDLADVQDLISVLHLPRELAVDLDESVRDQYLEYWEATQNATGPDSE